MSTVDRARMGADLPAEAGELGGNGGRQESPVSALAGGSAAAKPPAAEPGTQPNTESNTESIEHWYFCGDGSTIRRS